MCDCNDKSGAGKKKGLKQYDELHCVTSTVLSRTTQTQVVEANNSNSMKWGQPCCVIWTEGQKPVFIIIIFESLFGAPAAFFYPRLRLKCGLEN